MVAGATHEDLTNFLNYTLEKGLMKRATVAARKAVVNKVFEELDEEDRADVLSINLDDAMTRFVNKAGNKYSPDSLQTYKSRLKSTLEDFKSYRENPMGFKSAVATRTRKSKPGQTYSSDATMRKTGDNGNLPHVSTARPTVPSTDILPIPLRADLVVRIQGLPHDLTTSEASKICSVVRAFVPED